MAFQASKFHPLLPILVAASIASLVAVSAHAGTKVTFNPEQRDQPAPKQEKPAFHRKLWEGSFDRAGDQAGAVANQLEGGLEFNCEQYLGSEKTATKPAVLPNQAAFQDCRQREYDSRNYAKQARSIQKQQKVMSLVSKASDVAAVGAVGAVAYTELMHKKPNQASTYESAANIQRMASTASYATGATDLTLGAYAYVAQKRKLEEMKRTLTGKGASTDNSGLNSSLVSAVEATKKAAYNHMMYGAGKIAVGYGMNWLAKRSEKQADQMNTIAELTELNQIAAMRRAQGLPTVAASWPAGSSPPAPYYQNNQPVFTMPNSSGSSGLAASTGPVTYSIPNAGGSMTLPAGARGLATAGAGAKGSGIAGGGGGASAGGGGDTSGASVPPDDEAKAKHQKEALGGFETSLTGGPHGYGGAGAAASKDEVPSLASLIPGTEDSKPVAATGLSPNQMYSTALEGTEGTEQGSMAGVNGKSETSLFVITKEKLNKMFQVGNVGIPKEVEVKN